MLRRGITVALLLILSIPVYSQVYVDVAMKQNNEVVANIDRDKIKETWNEMLIRGTHINYKFSKDLFNRYYWRVIKKSRNSRYDTVRAVYNFRKHKKIAKLYSCRDVLKPGIDLSSPTVGMVITDYLPVRNGRLSSLEIDSWPWTKKEMSVYKIVRVNGVPERDAKKNWHGKRLLPKISFRSIISTINSEVVQWSEVSLR